MYLATGVPFGLKFLWVTMAIKEVQLFDRVIGRLRIRYEDRVIYFEEHLKEVVCEAA
jgi:hypothetical protein